MLIIRNYLCGDDSVEDLLFSHMQEEDYWLVHVELNLMFLAIH